MNSNNDLVEKYSNVLELIKDHKQHGNLATLFEICVKYFKERYNNIDVNIKISATYIIKELYMKGLISSDTQTIHVIDDYVSFHSANYSSFVKEYNNNDDFNFDTNMLFIKNYIGKITNNDNNNE
jgi:hypothetical protein